MKVRMQSYPVSQLSTRFLAASGDALLTSSEAGLTVTGAFKADAGFFGIAESAPPSLSDDVLVDRGAGAAEGPRERQRLVLDVRFNLGEHLHFSGRGLSTRLAGDVRLRGEPGRNLLASGQIRTVGGSYDAYGQELAIERGVLNFQGPLENPGLNVLAVREGLAVVAGVEIQGTVARPAVRLYSRPEVPDHEKLSWLVLGRGPTEANESDIGTLFAAANALLGTGREGRRLVRQFGFDEMRVTRADTQSALGVFPQSTVAGRTSSGSGSEVFTVGKRLTKDIYVSYQHGLADAEATLKFSYQVTQKLQLLLRASNNPGFDAVYRFTFE
jgi:translocation and assembly module TamB